MKSFPVGYDMMRDDNTKLVQLTRHQETSAYASTASTVFSILAIRANFSDYHFSMADSLRDARHSGSHDGGRPDPPRNPNPSTPEPGRDRTPKPVESNNPVRPGGDSQSPYNPDVHPQPDVIPPPRGVYGVDESTPPPAPLQRYEDRFVYTLNIDIRLRDKFIPWDYPFSIMFEAPDGTVQYFNLNEKGFSLGADVDNTFSVTVTTRNTGVGTCKLTDYNPHGLSKMTVQDSIYVHMN